MNFKTIKVSAIIFAATLGGASVFAQSYGAGAGADVRYDSKQDTLLKFNYPFKIDSSRIVKSADLEAFSHEVDSIVRTDSVTFVDITGVASIDGPEALNRRLAKSRAKSMADWIQANVPSIYPGMISISSRGEDWNWFLQLVENDPNLPAKREVIDIINSKRTIPQKEVALKLLNGGAVWRYMAINIFPTMRVAEVSLGGFHKYIVQIDEPVVQETVEVVEEVIEAPEPVVEVVQVEPADYWTRNLYVKTNAPAWLCLWINAAVELDLAPHWSMALPIYYSGFNYFTSKLKYRTFSVVPEVRYWPKAENMGFFVNGHLGMNLFNCADGGSERYQTYKGHTPALGGGVGIGYRWYFCKNHRWSMEAAVGAGVYKLDYSVFQNIHNGLIIDRRKKTWFGVDQAALSFEYSFGVQRKEVKK